MKGVEYHPLADEELSAVAVFYHSQAAGLGAALLDEVARTESLLAAHPEAGSVLRGDVRRFPLQRFPFHLIYRVRTESIWILAVAHYRRKPGYWSSRQAP